MYEEYTNSITGVLVRAYRAPKDGCEPCYNIRQGDWIVNDRDKKYIMSNLVFSQKFTKVGGEIV